MFQPIKVVDIELNDPPEAIEGLDGYGLLKGIVRLDGTPLGYVEVPVTNGRCTTTAIRSAIIEQLTWPIIRTKLERMLDAPPPPRGWQVPDIFQATPPITRDHDPLVTVAVCTRDRSEDLYLCLQALSQLDYDNMEILVVDNSPSDGATAQLVKTRFPHVRYVCEPRPGLDWARNRAIIAAKGEIIAYTDDDVIVDAGWLRALADIFAENPEVMAVTGLVVPYELETEAQRLFEEYGGFGRGFDRKWYNINKAAIHKENFYLGAGEFGTGANMAFRRSVFGKIGYFDTALDVGTVTNGGGDLEMFFRVIKEGYTLVYDPSVMVRHRHRRHVAQLRTQLANNGIGFYAYLVRSAKAYPSERQSIFRLGLWWLRWWNVRRFINSYFHPSSIPRDLIWAELKGSIIGLTRYQSAKKNARKIVEQFGPVPEAVMVTENQTASDAAKRARNATAIRTLELSQPITAMTDLAHYSHTRIYATWYGYPIGSVFIPNHHQSLSIARIRQYVANTLGMELLKLGRDVHQDTLWAETVAALTARYLPDEEQVISDQKTVLPDNVSVSVIVATYDRPDNLRKCLKYLVNQQTSRQVEIIVVDNNPESGLTAPVVAEYSDMIVIEETRKGLSYARNAGIAASSGDIVIATDDDVTMPHDWLEKLVGPFVQSNVMIVTGNVLPGELETHAQHLFEDYGGLGRGFNRFEVNGDWFNSYKRKAVPTWHIGATANAAFRATIFADPHIGLLDEALGVGTPTGCSEDTLLFYQVLRAGHTAVYEPGAYVWHAHRRTMDALKRQIYGYSKGHVAYHLTTLFTYHDFRALFRLTIELPSWYYKQLKHYLRRRLRRKNIDYPLSLTLIAITGNLAGPWSLWQSRRRVKQLGFSKPYRPRGHLLQTTPEQDALDSSRNGQVSLSIHQQIEAK